MREVMWYSWHHFHKWHNLFSLFCPQGTEFITYVQIKWSKSPIGGYLIWVAVVLWSLSPINKSMQAFILSLSSALHILYIKFTFQSKKVLRRWRRVWVSSFSADLCPTLFSTHKQTQLSKKYKPWAKLLAQLLIMVHTVQVVTLHQRV